MGRAADLPQRQPVLCIHQLYGNILSLPPFDPSNISKDLHLSCAICSVTLQEHSKTLASQQGQNALLFGVGLRKHRC